MKEILGFGIEKALIKFDIKATLTYNKDEYWHVYWIDDINYDKLRNIPDDQWEDDFGWWRWAEGSNLFCLDRDTFTVNGKPMIGYVDSKWEDMLQEYQEDEPEEDYTIDDIRQTKYTNLTSYICDELGASTERNVTAVAMDLAKMNNISLSELFDRYQ